MSSFGISILDSDLLQIDRELMDLRSKGIKNIHLDILDTSFTSNISFGPSVVNRILDYKFTFDIHVMVNKPLTILKQINIEKVDLVIIHSESEFLEESLCYLKTCNVKIGLAVNPHTKIENLNLDMIHMLLVMTVFPGYGGQKFIEEALNKITFLDRSKIKIGIDGGINLQNIEKVKQYDCIVIGSSYFKSGDKDEFLDKIRKILSCN